MTPPPYPRGPWQIFWASCRYALKGLRFAFISQRSFRIHLAAAFGVLAGAFLLRLDAKETALILAMVTLVLMAELINTALEVVLNLMEAREHPVVRAAKDVAAASVLMAVAGAAAVGVLILGPKLLERLGR
ncbi:MAG: diacylglycerol kinase family protein [Candidatus Omnitrophica bacterium]|nr:diacylglycerol kinase family protein [Candidatus Omnitrophota bacterium]